ncbi:MAG: DUF2892 domain-containing protein [Thiomicrorhabdus sp.]|nr:DUF2892 domain-containing protein [Thiomicrorhabdus sp.]
MKSNIMIRLIAIMILVPITLAHFTGQVDLTQPTWLWLTLFAGANALQASFTGFCPATKLFGKKDDTEASCNTDKK